MVLSFDEACSTLQRMFPQVHSEVISSILEVNQGHMERTVDCLLTIGVENFNLDSSSPVTSDTRVPSTTGVRQSRSQEVEDSRLALQLHRQMVAEELAEEQQRWGFWGGGGELAPVNRLTPSPLTPSPAINSSYPPPYASSSHNNDYNPNEWAANHLHDPVQGWSTSLNEGWQWMQSSSTWLAEQAKHNLSLVTSSLNEMVDEFSGEEANARNRTFEHPKTEFLRTSDEVSLDSSEPNNTERLANNISLTESIRDRKAHRTGKGAEMHVLDKEIAGASVASTSCRIHPESEMACYVEEKKKR
eukprot:CAMPEP_0196575796 /NCGR_PEP_ID=MMETSP1081-20130531/5199_1 /TAXON_ID=36882 /ORGANISM="Pyramimonas amylifera, Strain CCMP720" /LENGTH=301 /DNA_ID=CAMNT_0041894203 /DNA_START=33 /DNA_END=938 /DNA_ORIENTATION=+